MNNGPLFVFIRWSCFSTHCLCNLVVRDKVDCLDLEKEGKAAGKKEEGRLKGMMPPPPLKKRKKVANEMDADC